MSLIAALYAGLFSINFLRSLTNCLALSAKGFKTLASSDKGIFSKASRITAAVCASVPPFRISVAVIVLKRSKFSNVIGSPLANFSNAFLSTEGVASNINS